MTGDLRAYVSQFHGDARVFNREINGVESRSRVLSRETVDLAVINDPLHALESATTVSDIKLIRDKAEAVRKYAQNARLGLSVQNKAAELKLRAERKAGKALASMSLHGGDRRSKRHRERLKLADLGISQSQSRRWQMEASVPDTTFRRFVEAANKESVEITASGLLRIARALKTKTVEKHKGDAKRVPSPALSNCEELVEELLNHCHLFDSLISPICLSSESVSLKDGERRMLGRLMREFTQLLTSLRRNLERVERDS